MSHVLFFCHIEGRVYDRITTQTARMASICANEPCHVFFGAKE